MTTMTYGQLVEAYVAVREERDRLRAEIDRLRRRLGDVLDLEELPEDHTIVAAVRRLRAEWSALREQVGRELADIIRHYEGDTTLHGSTPDTGSTHG